jgi:hypothetical protein
LSQTQQMENVSHLEPKAMSVLAYLSREPGELVSKQEPIGAIWRDTLWGINLSLSGLLLLIVGHVGPTECFAATLENCACIALERCGHGSLSLTLQVSVMSLALSRGVPRPE